MEHRPSIDAAREQGSQSKEIQKLAVFHIQQLVHIGACGVGWLRQLWQSDTVLTRECECHVSPVRDALRTPCDEHGALWLELPHHVRSKRSRLLEIDRIVKLEPKCGRNRSCRVVWAVRAAGNAPAGLG